MSIETSKRFTLLQEGGFEDPKKNPNDPGAIIGTNFGIEQPKYDEWRTANGKVKRSVAQIERAEVDAIYTSIYLGVHADHLPEPLDLVVFDMAFNSGPGPAVKLLQRVVGIPFPDGAIGPSTLLAIAKAGDPTVVAMRLVDARLGFYSAQHNADSERGWFNQRIPALRRAIHPAS